jgi:large subunit ribosomal protein L7Ae
LANLFAATELFKMMNKYRPETKEQKEARLADTATSAAAGAKKDASKKPCFIKCGINHIATLVEQKKATMVVIAHDVDPIELVLWLPALCRKMDVPYCIVKGKARLGAVVHKKNATALAFTGVRKEDEGAMAKLCDSVRGNFNDKYDEFKKWGGGIMGAKSQERTRQKEKAFAREAAKRAQI